MSILFWATVPPATPFDDQFNGSFFGVEGKEQGEAEAENGQRIDQAVTTARGTGTVTSDE
jgi:hypothetical protein